MHDYMHGHACFSQVPVHVIIHTQVLFVKPAGGIAATSSRFRNAIERHTLT